MSVTIIDPDKQIVHGTVTQIKAIRSINDLSAVPWERGMRHEQAPMDKAAMKRNLFDVADVLDKHHVEHRLMLGTLLGAVRDHDFIGHDNDSDLMCLWPDYTKMSGVIDELQTDYGFFVPRGAPIHDVNFIRDGEKVELWWFGEFDGRLVYYPRFWIWPKWFFETETFNFLGRNFKIPKDYDGVLRHWYEGDWRIPAYARWCGCEDKVKDNNF